MSDVEQGIRPERPMAVSSVASQMGICASPVSVAVVSILAFMTTAGYDYSVVQILAVSIPATGFGAHMSFLKEALGTAVASYPWAYAIVAFLTSKLVNSQAAAIAIVVPMALSAGMEPVIIMSFISACYGYFFLPTYPSDLACIGFDRSVTTRICKYILNRSFMIPGLIGVISGCCMGFVIAHIVF